MFYNIRCDNSLKVRIAAFQAVGPGSIPGCRKQKFFFLEMYKKFGAVKKKNDDE